MRIVFAGSPDPAVVVLRGLLARGHEVAAVVTQPDRPRGRGGRTVPTPVGRVALDLGLPLMRPASINAPEVLAELGELDAGALCVVGFGQILRDGVLSGWPCINVHFSLLPAYRGAAPVERAIMDGLERTGVTIMQMDAGLDTGPIIRAAERSIGSDDDAGTLLAALAQTGGDLLADVLDEMTPGVPPSAVPQPDEGVSLAPKITSQDIALDLSAPARDVVNRVRALSPHIGARLTLAGEPFKIWSARVSDTPRRTDDAGWADGGRLFLPAGDGCVEVRELQPPNRARMGAGDFLRGWRRGFALG